jgi:hypothetical protein
VLAGPAIVLFAVSCGTPVSSPSPSPTSVDAATASPATSADLGATRSTTSTGAAGIETPSPRTILVDTDVLVALSFLIWDPLAAELAAGYALGTFTPAAIKIEQTEGPESGFTRPSSGAPNMRYLSAADPVAAESTLLAILNGP